MLSKCKKCGGSVLLVLTPVVVLGAEFDLDHQGNILVGVAQVINTGVTKFIPTFICTSCGKAVEDFNVICSGCMRTHPIENMSKIVNSEGNPIRSGIYCPSCVDAYIRMTHATPEEVKTSPIQYKNLIVRAESLFQE